MPFAYVTEPGAAVHCRGRTLLVKKPGQMLAEWEIAHLEALVLVSGVHLSKPAIKALLRAGVETAFLSNKGKLIGQLTPPNPGNVPLRWAQYALANQIERRVLHARAMVTERISVMDDVRGQDDGAVLLDRPGWNVFIADYERAMPSVAEDAWDGKRHRRAPGCEGSAVASRARTQAVAGGRTATRR